MARFVLVCATILFSAASLRAQIIRAPGGDPPVLVTATLGFMQLETVADGSTSSVWDFGSALQYRVALEKRLGDRMGIGAMVAYASVPLRYISLDPLGGPTTCSGGASSCNASVDHTTIAALFSTGGSYGFHQVLNLGVGVVMYNNFREDGTSRALAPLKSDTDFFLSLGYGIGIGLSNRVSINLVQDYSLVMHQRAGLDGNDDTQQNLLLTRLGVRLGVGR